MGKIFLFSIRRMIRQRCAVWFFLMIGMTLLSFCISVILGFVSRSYFNETQFGANASLAVWYGENGSNQEDVQQLLESPISEQAENILFISKDKNMRLIGWKGFGIDQWFPHSTGRFFSEDEEKDGEMVAYIHHDKYDALNRTMKYEGENYHIVGAGFLEAWNIYSPISNESPQTLFSMDNMELEIVLFPYTTYLMRKNPELVLIHFPNSTYSELKRRKEQLEDICQNAIVTMPRSNTDIFLQEQVISRGKITLIFMAVIGITMIQLITEWIIGNYKQYVIFYQCGIHRTKILMLTLLEWNIEVLICSQVAFCIHKFLMPVLKIFGADTLPIFLLRIASVAMIIIASSIVVGLQFIRLPFMGREIDG